MDIKHHKYLKQNGVGQFTLDELTLQVATSLGLQTQAGKSSLAYFFNQAVLLDKKQQDYGPRNISTFGIFGIVVRMSDKLERLKNLLTTRRRKARNEPFWDSMIDVSNYGVIGQMVHNGEWPMGDADQTFIGSPAVGKTAVIKTAEQLMASPYPSKV